MALAFSGLALSTLGDISDPVTNSRIVAFLKNLIKSVDWVTKESI